MDGHTAPLVLVFISCVHALLGLQIAVEVVGNQVLISSIDQSVDQVDEGLSVATKGSTLDGLIHAAQALSNVATVALVHCTLCLGDFLDIFAKDKHVLDTDLLGDLHIGSIHGTDNQASIHDELHV